MVGRSHAHGDMDAQMHRGRTDMHRVLATVCGAGIGLLMAGYTSRYHSIPLREHLLRTLELTITTVVAAHASKCSMHKLTRMVWWETGHGLHAVPQPLSCMTCQTRTWQ